MTHYRTDTTIAAIATPPGQGGIGVIRISGPESRDIAEKLFRATRTTFAGFLPYRLHHGRLVDSEGHVLDEILAAFMPGPNSFTGEDTIELHCHGGSAVLKAVLGAVLEAGAVPAGPGEFSYRAFMNGKMDLTQAEAIAEAIHARSRTALDMAQTKLEGLFGRRVQAMREVLEGLRAQLCLAVDFPEDDIECLPPEEFAAEVGRVREQIEEMLAAFRRSRPFREGASVVLAGRVNAGKSSLMNAIIGRERAIVTDLPGTTRDYLEEETDLQGLSIRLVDTAGLREAEDEVEREGVRRSRRMLDEADVVLLVVDGSIPLDDEDMELLETFDQDRTICAVNKADRIPANPEPGNEVGQHGFEAVHVSAKTGYGLEELINRIREKISSRTGEPEHGELVPNLRQSQALERADEELSGLLKDIEAGMPFDLLGVRLEGACAVLSEITGEIAPEEVLNKIFSSFCIGK